MEIKTTTPVKCISGIIYNNKCKLSDFLANLERVFGKIDDQSILYSFDFTDYYEAEMGNDLQRVFVSFERLKLPDRLPEIKHLSNRIEEQYRLAGGRMVNMDPGYLDLDKFVLTSAKYAGQKIYLSEGIYADPTLYFHKKAFHAYPWSFPDFSEGIYDDFFLRVRNKYKMQLKK